MMRLTIGAVAAGVAVLVAGFSASAQDHGGMVMVPDAGAVQWQANPAGLPKGTKIAVLAGDPGKPGPFGLIYVRPSEDPNPAP